MSTPQLQTDGTRAYYIGVGLIAGYQIVLAILLFIVLLILWPEPDTHGAWSPGVHVGSWRADLTPDGRLMLLVLCTGALGSYIHSATSFVSFVGNRRLMFSWAPWYLMRPFIGMALAMIFYFVLRGGLITSVATSSEMSPFGVAAISGMVGMFSKQAADKLGEVFDNLFRTAAGQGDDSRADKLGVNVPVTDVMIDRRKIAALVVPEGQGAEDIRVVDLHRLLGGVVTRVPVMDHKNVLWCVVHESLLYKFLADRSIEEAAHGRTFDAGGYTLEEFLEAPGMRKLVQDSVVFVPVGAMVSEAKERMERTPHCQDIFVTENGLANQPVQGWLTDTEVLRVAKA